MADQSNPNLNEFLGVKQQSGWRSVLGRPWIKWPLILVGALLLILLAMRMFGGSAAPQYRTQDVTSGELKVTVSATGKLAPVNQVTVGSQLSGQVTQVLVDVNDKVVKGQPLALIDPEQLDDSIRQNQAALNANLASVATAQATLQEAQAQLARFVQVSQLSGGKVPAKTEMDTARATVARAVAGVRSAQANVAAARAQLSSSQIQRARAVIRSPVTGVVLARQIDPGQTVAASFNTPTLFVIAEDLTSMKLEVAIDEADVGQVSEGQKATFTVDAFPGQTFPAAITRVDVGSNLSASSASSSSSTTTTSTSNQVVSYAATLSVANPTGRLRPGMTATAEIVTNQVGGTLLVPNAALRYVPTSTKAASSSGSGGISSALIPKRPSFGGSDDKSATNRGPHQTVYVVGDDGKPRAIAINTGLTNGVMTQVTGGALKPGMKVIVGQASGTATDSSGGKRG